MVYTIDKENKGESMKLNRIEFLAMNNPIRRLSQKHIEFKRFEKFISKQNISLKNATILDAGCGSGYSSKLISKRFKPKELIAFDFMPEQIKIAKKKNPYAKYHVDDITSISQPDEKFDATFVFGILHHVPDWKQGIKELYRTLKKGGYLFAFEVNDKGVLFVDKYLKFSHPPEANFNWKEFSKSLTDANFTIAEESKLVFECFRAFACRKD